MSDSSSPRLQVFINSATATTRVLAELKGMSSLGFADLKALIASGAPVLDVEMFTNDWYESGAARLLDLLADWEARGVDYALHEATVENFDGADEGEIPKLTLDELRNIIHAEEDELARLQELDDLRYEASP